MKTIWKVTLKKFTGIMEFQFPKDFEILSVVNQYQNLVMYVQVDIDKPDTNAEIMIVGTGRALPSFCGLKRFIGTVLFDSDSYVAHVYEIKGE